jgi:broad specificity phosphatase PhoE
MTRVASSLIAVALMFGVATTAWAQTTVILVRHAEKAAEPASDPPLTPEGRARARALWQAVKDAGVDAVITTQLARTIQTAAPTVSQRHLTPEVVQAGGPTHPTEVAAAVKRHRGQTVLVVGHSNTIPAIIGALGAPQPPAICDSEYDGFYLVQIDVSGKATLLRTRYGAPSPGDPACASMK